MNGLLGQRGKLIYRHSGNRVLFHQGAWKIAGFDFCVSNSAPANQPPSWAAPEYSHTTPPEGYPDLVSSTTARRSAEKSNRLGNPVQDFLAPEYALAEDSCSPASDMFSLGMVAFALFNSKPLFTNSGNWGVYKKNSKEVRSTTFAIFV